jgi:hypothetical protein
MPSTTEWTAIPTPPTLAEHQQHLQQMQQLQVPIL